jgi:hypothetical protein
MGIFSRLRDGARTIGRSVVRSEVHSAEIAASSGRIEATLNRLTAVAEQAERRIADLSAIAIRREILAIMDDPKLAEPLRLERHGFRVHSQYDEDGIIDEIFRRIGPTDRTFVEFGAGDGTENCTGFLLMQGWRGLWIDGQDSFLPFVHAAWGAETARGQLVARNVFVEVDTIDGIIQDAGFSGEIDFLSLDVDGNDYHFLENLSAISPRVICTEYNMNIPPHVAWHMERRDGYIWEGLDYRIGASLKALEILMAGRGYALVGCSLAAANAFFVRADLVEDKFAAPFTAENHYHFWRSFYRRGGYQGAWREWVDRR